VECGALVAVLLVRALGQLEEVGGRLWDNVAEQLVMVYDFNDISIFFLCICIILRKSKHDIEMFDYLPR
jgi:hypothetical protein